MSAGAKKFKKLSSMFGALCLVSATTAILLFSLFDQTFHLISIFHLAVSFCSLVLFLFLGGFRALFLRPEGEVDQILRGEFWLQQVYTVLFAAVLILVGLIINRYAYFGLDLTENNAYSLSDHSQKVLKKLDKPVLVRGFFLGAEVPPRVRELLDRYSAFSPNFRWKALDPDRNRPVAEALGIQEKDTLHFSFSGQTSIDAGGGSNLSGRGITLVRDLDEEGITNSLIKLSSGVRAQVYVSSLNGEGEVDNTTEVGFSFLSESISGEGFDIVSLDIDEREFIPVESSVLLVISPKRPFIEAQEKKISQYLLKGGSAVFLVEPLSVPILRGILEPLGFVLGEDTIVDKEAFTFQGTSLGVQPLIDTFSDHPAVRGFKKTIIFTTANSVRKAAMADEVRELAFTSTSSWAETDLQRLYSDDPVAEMGEGDIKGPVSVAAAREQITGSKTGRIVVIGDSDFLTNINIRQLFNRDFFLNILNWVSGEQEVLAIRSGTLKRSQHIITPDQLKGIFIIVGILLPEILLVFGLSAWIGRRG
ncbi:MAG TPA: Gldg family protein [Oligoflexia bacterium]|nr:Gldg family protein [Oligoflexia bacterium]HMP48540.1 Gldg family protein [Oligoflexia bacterium]